MKVPGALLFQEEYGMQINQIGYAFLSSLEEFLFSPQIFYLYVLLIETSQLCWDRDLK